MLGQTLCQVAREIRFPRKVTHSDGKLGSIFLTERGCSFLEGRWPPVQHFMVYREVSRSPCAPRRKPCASEGSPGHLPHQLGGGSPPTYPSSRVCPRSPFRPRSGVFSGSCPRSCPQFSAVRPAQQGPRSPPLVAVQGPEALRRINTRVSVASPAVRGRAANCRGV